MEKTVDQTFVWEGVNKEGQRVKGEVYAPSPSAARAQLQRQQISPTKIRKKRKPLLVFSEGIKFEDIVLFCRHLTTMLSAGLPLVQALESIASGHSKEKMRELLMTVKNNVASGQTLADSLSKHPEYFSELLCSMVKVGEESGTLDTTLAGIAGYLEKSETLRKKIKKAFIYPGVVVAVSIGLSLVLLLFVIPQFKSLFENFDAELPYFTRLVVGASEFLEKYWLLFGGAIAIGGWFIARFAKRSERFKASLDAIMLKLFILGPILKKAIIARFARTLSTTLSAGIPLPDALQSVAKAAGNRVYTEAILRIREDVTKGQQIHQAISSTQLFPSMVIQMVSVGEQSGSTDAMLDKLASYYEEEVNTTVDNLSNLLEPLILVILGVIIGGFVVAMYLPIFKLGSIF